MEITIATHILKPQCGARSYMKDINLTPPPKAKDSAVNEIERQQHIEECLKHIAGAIEHTIEHEFGRMGFALLVFEFNKPGISNYVSNARREDMIKSLRETADRLENRQDIPPGHTSIQ